MLIRLNIQNYAIIEKLEIDFSKGLTIITGETGAGKSILLGALGLILGNRSDSSVLSDKSVKCIVEGLFEINRYKLRSFFENRDLDYDDRTVIRREISPDGKSRAFINDTPVTLTTLKDFAARLVDIHSQHETLRINESDFQLGLLDVFGHSEEEAVVFGKRFKQLKEKQNRLAALLNESERQAGEEDFLRFQLKELQEAGIMPGEAERLEEEASALAHAQKIKEALESVVNVLHGSENNILTQLHGISSLLRQAARHLKAAEPVEQRFQTVMVELKDLTGEIEDMAVRTEMNPERLKIIEARLDLLNRLMQKHRLNNTDALLGKMEEIEKRLALTENTSEEIQKLRMEISEEETALYKSAGELSRMRQKSAETLIGELKKMLSGVGMPEAVIQIEFSKLSVSEMNETGIDRVYFLFSANKGTEPAPLSKVASGGELSRLMLCIKSLIADKKSLPTIIFDEIDTGISGNTALKVGNIISNMATGRQVITITHLAQMAGKGQTHYHVIKESRGNKTVVRIVKLDREERVREIARMLTGDRITDAGLKNARELMKEEIND